MVLDKFVEIEFGGKKHMLCYPIKYVWEAERHLSEGNFLVLVSRASKGIPPTVYDMFVVIKYALMGGDPKLTEEQAEELYIEAIGEKSLEDVARLAMLALKKSGVLGKDNGKKAPAAPEAPEA